MSHYLILFLEGITYNGNVFVYICTLANILTGSASKQNQLQYPVRSIRNKRIIIYNDASKNGI